MEGIYVAYDAHPTLHTGNLLARGDWATVLAAVADRLRSGDPVTIWRVDPEES